ncbi:MAG TPA: helix-hairpin-helix domain-containing protein [Gemmataceae bacterium]|jgi:competence protein ComEA|nr:helix-hairpin-helix domain-containing protein [Gemmataceae bacterium]
MDTSSCTPVPATSPTTPPAPAAVVSKPDVFTAPVQLALFIALLGLVGFVAWNSIPPTRPTETRADQPPIRVDINRADRGELMMLPGIGPNLADRILDYRETHGPFDGLADLRKVSGIGPATLEKLRPRIQMSWSRSPSRKSEPDGMLVLAAKMPTKSAKTTALSDAIDINRAGLAELRKLPGIGPKLSQRIVDTRTIRPFASVDELRRVPGIGVKTLEKIRPYAMVEPKSAAIGHID